MSEIITAPMQVTVSAETGTFTMARANAALDGVEHNGMPGVQHG